MKIIPAFAVVLLVVAGLLALQDKIEFKTIDGVPHALNPAKPLKGTVRLEVERTRTIDPYEQPDVGLKYMLFSRDEAGNVILFDPNQAEGHRFGPNGDYFGPLTKKGQGPGEFSQWQGYRAYFLDSKIWVFGGRKVSLFDAGGRLLAEKTLKNSCESCVDPSHFLSRASSRAENNDPMEIMKLVRFSFDGEESAVDLFEATNVGMIRHPSRPSAFADQWGTPRIFVASDPAAKRVYCGLNTEYKIRVKDYDGKDLLVIQKEHKNAKASRAEVEKIMSWAVKDEGSKWMLDAYPDHFVAIVDILPLPKGYLAVCRVKGAEAFEIDVFDPSGRYLYALLPPDGFKAGKTQFFATGFAAIEENEDSFVYQEYRIKNLPEVFGK
jgi:hypothetical protein